MLSRLKNEWTEKGKASLFDTLKIFLTIDRNDAKYAETAARHGFTESYLRVNTPRLRKRYRDLLKEEIRQTIEAPEMIDEEIHALFGAFK